MQYAILTSPSLDELVDLVNVKIKLGWVPSGSVFTYVGRRDSWFCQPMINNDSVRIALEQQEAMNKNG